MQGSEKSPPEMATAIESLAEAITYLAMVMHEASQNSDEAESESDDGPRIPPTL